MNSTAHPTDVAGEMADGMTAAWNAHDMAAFAALFHEDAAFINVIGSQMNGRAQIEQQHSAVHAGHYRNSALRMRVADARQLASTVIVAHLASDLDGDDRRPGETVHTILTLVIELREAWQIAAAHNTRIMQVRAQPS